jgi:PAP2 superfamily.
MVKRINAERTTPPFILLCAWLFFLLAPDSARSGENGFFKTLFSGFSHDVVTDYRNYYSLRSLPWLGLNIGVAGALANTDADQKIRDYYQDDVRSPSSDDISDIWRKFGDYAQFEFSAPTYLGAMILGAYYTDSQIGSTVGEWGSRSLRTLILGAPQHFFLTNLLGGKRPTEGDSNWRPFDGNRGASGHAFYGAVPIINAARMVHNRPVRYLLYGLSLFPAWSRINDDKHFFSQALLGWSLAYLSASAVDKSEKEHENVTWIPTPLPDGGGIFVHIAF